MSAKFGASIDFQLLIRTSARRTLVRRLASGKRHLAPSTTSQAYAKLRPPPEADMAQLVLSVPVRKSYCRSATLEFKMARGTVKWFNSQKGYGFIQPQGGGGKDVFVHISAVEKAGLSGLNEGQIVDYDEVPNKGKTSAENLKVQR
jgi:cold shock protein